MKKYGLNEQEVQESLARYGNNALSSPPRDTFLDKLLDNFKDPIIRILIFALIVNVVFVFMGHGDWIEACGIFIAILLATLVSTYSEYSNENAFQKLQEEASRIRCKVWRNGEPVEIHIDDIVVGDAIILEAGDKIPVDGILLAGDVKLDQAALNGESLANLVSLYVHWNLETATEVLLNHLVGLGIVYSINYAQSPFPLNAVEEVDDGLRVLIYIFSAACYVRRLYSHDNLSLGI